MKDNGIWFEDLFAEKISGCEKLIRHLNNLANDCGLVYRINKYPIYFERPQYEIIIIKKKQDKLFSLYKVSEMELEVALKKINKWLTAYKDEHKRYDLQKPGGGEMI